MTEAMTVLRELAAHRASTRLLTSDDARAIVAHIDSLTAELAAAKAERDEADRRAGAAERQLEHANDNIRARTRWLDQAKDDAGFHRNVSFDKVWAAALAAYKVAIASGAHLASEGDDT